MNRAEQAQQAELFRNKHRGPRLLLLPNAWDAMSARVFVAAGFDAIATTSGGVAWSLGYADGEQTPWEEVVAATARIVRAARVPVTADIEAGYGETADAVMRSVAQIIGAGAVGVHPEGGTPPFGETVEGGRAYLAAGADCIYPIGLRDPATIGRLVKALGAPININVRAGSPSVAELEALGVGRASTASQVALRAMSLTRQVANDRRATGRFDKLAPAMSQADAQRLFSRLS